MDITLHSSNVQLDDQTRALVEETFARVVAAHENHVKHVHVTLLDRNDSWYFGYSKLDVMLGRRSADEIRLPYSDVVKDGVEFRQVSFGHARQSVILDRRSDPARQAWRPRRRARRRGPRVSRRARAHVRR